MESTAKSNLGGAWVLIFSPNLKYVMMAKRAPTSNNPNLWNFWGGGIDKGEKPKQAAVRELREESGIRLTTKQLTRIGRVGRYHYFGIILPMKTRPHKMDKKENSKFKWMKVKTLKSKMKKFNPPTKAAVRNNIHKETKEL